MKIRSGFVSNSSSSSFVLYGVKIPQNEIAEETRLNGVDCIEDGRFYLIGKTLAHEIEDMGITEITPDETLKENIKEILSSYGVDMLSKKHNLNKESIELKIIM